jgi:hypothetical protein
MKLNLSLKTYEWMYRVSQEECAILREGVSYVKIYRYNPKHLCPKLNGYGDNIRSCPPKLEGVSFIRNLRTAMPW